ncbi:hypothetical protein DL770_006789 [Monosporascus sp. CRB-9-2]|nr:hypothetical protein DL770_006789 [Monosporascus sp. CRB-9-2]
MQLRHAPLAHGAGAVRRARYSPPVVRSTISPRSNRAAPLPQGQQGFYVSLHLTVEVRQLLSDVDVCLSDRGGACCDTLLDRGSPCIEGGPNRRQFPVDNPLNGSAEVVRGAEVVNDYFGGLRGLLDAVNRPGY